jgi:multidrug efflux pump subunit AcrA (membrane-fusion protein)
MDRDDLDRAKLEAEVAKLQAETHHLLGTPWTRFTETVKVVGAIVATIVAGWAAVKTWQINELQTRITREELGKEEVKLKQTKAALAKIENELIAKEKQRVAAEKLARAAQTLASAGIAQQQPVVAATPTTSTERWVYVGLYRPETKTWETKYLAFTGNPDPLTLEGRDLPVNKRTGALNVRPGIPNGNGLLSPPVDVLSENARVHINRMQRWGTSLWFANVAYYSGT